MSRGGEKKKKWGSNKVKKDGGSIQQREYHMQRPGCQEEQMHALQKVKDGCSWKVACKWGVPGEEARC